MGGAAVKHKSKGSIIDKPFEISMVTLEEKPKIKVKKKKSKKQRAPGDCDNFFGGIGINLDVRTPGRYQYIEKVFDGYPAQAAGLRAGDKIVEPSVIDITGQIGTGFHLTYLRDGSYYTVWIIRDKICTSGKSGPIEPIKYGE